jgi:hypothetical protein
VDSVINDTTIVRATGLTYSQHLMNVRPEIAMIIIKLFRV